MILYKYVRQLFSQGWFKIFLLALIVKIIIFNIASNWLGGDEFFYISRGLHLSNGYTPYTDFFNCYGPTLMYIFSIPHFFFKNSYVLLRVLIGFVDIFNAILIFSIGKHLNSEKVGYVASLIYIFNYLSINVASATMSEPYIVFFILTGCYFIYVRKNHILSAFSFACALLVKLWIGVFIIPGVFLLLFQRKIKPNFLIFMGAFLIIITLPFVIHEDFFINQKGYYKLHHNYYDLNKALSLTHMKIITSIIMNINPASAIPIVFLVLYLFGRRKERLNFFHPWFIGNIIFFFFPKFYWDHHPLLTLPPACIISAQWLKPLFKNMPLTSIFTSIIIISSMVAMSPFHKYYDNNGNHPIPKESTLDVINAIKSNYSEGNVILEDFAIYSYLSQLPTTTFHGWHWNSYPHEDVLRIIEEGRPSHIIITSNGAWPRESRIYIGSKFDLIYEAKNGVKVYYTGLNESKTLPGIEVEILKNRLSKNK